MKDIKEATLALDSGDRDQITFKHMNKSMEKLCACADSRKVLFGEDP